MSQQTQMAAPVLTTDDLLAHWQGHRGLTRRVIEAFPDDQLHSFSVGGMRPFAALAWEMYGVAAYTLHGLTTDDWSNALWNRPLPDTRAELLSAWDELSTQLADGLPGVPPARYHEVKQLVWATMPVHAAVMYAIDNEIHHRSQGYVYLRALGIEPPAFYER